jgi:hypothetical protein
MNNPTASAHAALHAPENKKLQNDLMEAKDGEPLDFGETTAASGARPGLATGRAINRA